MWTLPRWGRDIKQNRDRRVPFGVGRVRYGTKPDSSGTACHGSNRRPPAHRLGAAAPYFPITPFSGHSHSFRVLRKPSGANAPVDAGRAGRNHPCSPTAQICHATFASHRVRPVFRRVQQDALHGTANPLLLQRSPARHQFRKLAQSPGVRRTVGWKCCPG